jgi:NitT/TauT family transport system substrate-binding protein
VSGEGVSAKKEKITMPVTQTRRRVLTTLALGAAANLVHVPRSLAEERLETTTVRLNKSDSICVAPQYVAEDLLRGEGFTDVHYVQPTNLSDLAQIDFTGLFASSVLLRADANAPFSVLSGLHVGCFELFANDSIRSVVDLKGKRIGLPALGGSPPHAFISVMAAQVGLDPARDIDWVITSTPAELLVAGKIDAMMGFPPESQELRARKIGHVVVDSSVDRPWSDYFCCMLIGSQDYIRKYPIAAKRVVRAILKAADLCASDPAGMARRLVDTGYAKKYDYTVEALRELPYDKWREYDPEDTIRFYALRLREAGLIKSTPQKIIADHTDWRLLNELKRELKA